MSAAAPDAHPLWLSVVLFASLAGVVLIAASAAWRWLRSRRKTARPRPQRTENPLVSAYQRPAMTVEPVVPATPAPARRPAGKRSGGSAAKRSAPAKRTAPAAKRSGVRGGGTSSRRKAAQTR